MNSQIVVIHADHELRELCLFLNGNSLLYTTLWIILNPILWPYIKFNFGFAGREIA